MRQVKGSEPPIGFATMVSEDALPTLGPGWLPADGRRLRKSVYAELWAAFRGAGTSGFGRWDRYRWWPWFRLPDWREDEAKEWRDQGLCVCWVIRVEPDTRAMARDLANWRW